MVSLASLVFLIGFQADDGSAAENSRIWRVATVRGHFTFGLRDGLSFRFNFFFHGILSWSFSIAFPVKKKKKAMHDQRENFVSEYLVGRSNPRELYIHVYRAFGRTKHFTGVKCRYHRSNTTRNNTLRISIFQKNFRNAVSVFTQAFHSLHKEYTLNLVLIERNCGENNPT